MPDSRIKWTASGDWLTHLGGGGAEFQTVDIATIPAGLVSTDNATILGVNTIWLNSGGAANTALQVKLPDNTLLVATQVTALGISGLPNGWMYVWSLTDARLALGGTLQFVEEIISIFGARDNRGLVAAVLVDAPGPLPTAAVVGYFGGGSDSPKTTHLTDPYPYLTFAMVGLSTGGSVPITMTPADGWELLEEMRLSGVGAIAIASYVPVVPLVDAEFTISGGPSGIISLSTTLAAAVIQHGRAFAQVIG